jgi:hypothetical protein
MNGQIPPNQPATKCDIQQVLERLERFESNLLSWFAAAERRAMGGDYEQESV